MFLSILLLLQAAAPDAAQPAPEKPKEKVICREIEETGSRIATKRICMTATQWRQQQRDARESVEQTQRMGLIQPKH